MLITGWLTSLTNRIFTGRKKAARRSGLSAARFGGSSHAPTIRYGARNEAAEVQPYIESLEERVVPAVVSGTNAFSSDFSGEASTVIVSVTETLSGQDRAIIASFVTYGSADGPTSVTYDSQTMTLATSNVLGLQRIDIYYLAIGDGDRLGAFSVEATYGAAVEYAATATIFEGVDQTTPVSGAQTGDTGSLSVSSGTGDLVFDVLLTNSSEYAAGPDQSLTNSFSGMQEGGFYSATSVESGATLTEMTWLNLSDGTLHAAVNINQDSPTLPAVGTAELVTASASGTEGGTLDTAPTVRVTGTGVLTSPLVLNVTGTGTATSGIDYSLTGTVTFPIGTDLSTNPSAPVDFSLLNDLSVEDTETVSLSISVNSTGDTITAAAATTEITIQDDADVASFDVGSVMEAEGSTTRDITIPVTLTAAVQGGLTASLSLSPVAVTGVLPTIELLTPTLTFTGTADEVQNATIRVYGDLTVSPDKVLQLVVSTATAPSMTQDARITTGTSGSVQVLNDDTAMVTLGSPGSVSESLTTLQIPVTLDNAVEGGFSVPVNFIPGTADVTDFTLLTPILTFAGTAGEIQYITIQINNDLVVEDAETFGVSLGLPTTNLVLSGASIQASELTEVVTIQDDDESTITIAPVTALEGNGPGALTFAVTSTNAVQGGFSLPWSVSDVTTNSSDYTYISNGLTFSGMAGEVQYITISITDDAVVETDEELLVALGTPVASFTTTALTTGGDGTGVIQNDDNTTLSMTAVSGEEGGILGYITLDVTSQNAVEGGFSVTINLTGGTASILDLSSPGGDPVVNFVGIAGEVQQVLIPIIEDAVVEGTETAQFTLGTVTTTIPSLASSITSGASTTANITDNDTTTVTATDAVVVESPSGATLTFPVVSSHAVEGGFSVGFTVAGVNIDPSEYIVLTSSPLVFAGSSEEIQFVTVQILDDSTVESLETLTLTLDSVLPTSNPEVQSLITLGPAATGQIIDNDTTTLEVSSPTVTEGDSGDVTMTFNVTLPAAVDGGVTVDFSVTSLVALDSDYTVQTTGPLVFAGTAGEVQTIIVTIHGDTIVEPDELLNVTLSNVVALGTSNPPSVGVGSGGVGTILNDDTATITVTGNTVNEGASEAVLVYTFELSNVVQDGLTLSYTFFGTATVVDDFTPASIVSVVTFAGNEGEQQTVLATVFDDSLVEADETAGLNLVLGPTDIALQNIVVPETVTATIEDDDVSTLSISNSPTVTEGAAGTTEMTFFITNSANVPGGFSVEVNVTDLSTSGTDYTISSASPLVFEGTVGETVPFTILVNGDLNLELDETLQITLGAVTPLGTAPAESIITGAVATGTIVNDDSAILSIDSVTDTEGSDGTKILTFNVVLSGIVEGGFTVDFDVAHVTTDDSDFTVLTPGPLTFAGTEGEIQTIQIQVDGDQIVELDEQFSITLGTVTASDQQTSELIETGVVATGTIQNDDITSISITAPTITEGNQGSQEVVFTVTSSLAVQGGFDLAFVLVPIFTDENDLTLLTTSPLTFAGTAGETQTITLQIHGDTIVESDEMFHVILSQVTPTVEGIAGIALTNPLAVATILNDDTTTLTLSDAVAVEGSNLTFTLTSSNASQIPFQVMLQTTLQTAGMTDLTFNPSPIVIFSGTAGETQQITFTGMPDLIVEGDETIALNVVTVIPLGMGNQLAYLFAETGSATGTITDDDISTLTVSSPTVVEGDDGFIELIFDVTSPLDVVGPFTVDFEVTGGTAGDLDYAVMTTGPLEFLGLAGETQTVTVRVFGDRVVEPSETLTLTLGTVNAEDNVPTEQIVTGAVGTGTITDNDSAIVTLSAVNNGTESLTPANAQFLISLSAASSTDTVVSYTVAGTAIAGADYETLSGTVTIPAGQTSATINVAVLADLLVESDETVIMTLTDVTDGHETIYLSENTAELSATVVITSDNQPVFISPDEVDVDENTSTSTVVATAAIDMEMIGEALVTFTLSGPDADLFDINPVTGEITFKNSPDFEQPADADFDNRYELTVTATVGVTPLRSQTQDLVISVTPVNDNVPQFENSSPTFTIAENTPLNTVVGTVAAFDADLPAQTLIYSITSGNESGAFGINPATGEIFVANPALLNFETVTSFTLEIQVVDGEGTALTSTATAVINVTDVDEGPTLVNPFPNGMYYLKNIPAFIVPDAYYQFQDVERPNYEGATMTVSIVSGRGKTDKLSVYAKGPGNNRINVKGKKLFFSDVEIGRISGGRRDNMVITFNSQATSTGVDALVRRLNFYTRSDIGTDRTISVVLNDVEGRSSNIMTRVIEVVPPRNSRA